MVPPKTIHLFDAGTSSWIGELERILAELDDVDLRLAAIRVNQAVESVRDGR